MIIRRIAESIRAQDWFVVTLEVMIVVVGIFLGLQVDDWNKERTFHRTETELLGELKRELEASIQLTEGRLDSYKAAAEAGSRSLDFISSGASCDANCWPILRDFLHASQWQGVQVRKSTYENMRTLGMPSNRAIIDAVEAYLSTTRSNVEYYGVLPEYRSLVRRLVPLKVQEHYWEHCYLADNGLEYYKMDCPMDVSSEFVAHIVGNIVRNEDIKPYLTGWTSSIISAPSSLGDQNFDAREAISLIDKELALRQ